MQKPSYQELPISLRALLLRSGYSRLIEIRNTHASGYLLSHSDQVDELYIRLLRSIRDILATPGLEPLAVEFPSELPESLHDIGVDEVDGWEFVQDPLNSYRGKINRFCVEFDAPQSDELEKTLYENVDVAIAHFKHLKSEQDKRFISRATGSARTPLPSGIIPPAILEGTRGYLEAVCAQVNGCYSHGFYDACAVMARRLVETLLIECFEATNAAALIQDGKADFLPLDKIISVFLTQPNWNASRDTKKALTSLPRLKAIGDRSAHNRRYIAGKEDIDKAALDLRVVIQELVAIAFPAKK